MSVPLNQPQGFASSIRSSLMSLHAVLD